MNKNSSVIWYLKRLFTFSPKEFIFRIKQYSKNNFVDRLKKKENSFTGLVEINPIFNVPEELLGQLEFSKIFPVFERTYETSEIHDWHYDYYSGNSFPLLYYKDINIRSPKIGSAKHVWEINRMLFLPQLAIAFRKTSDEKYLFEIYRLLNSWSSQNPYLMGVNWYSNIEINIRLINWVWTWEILNGDQLYKENNVFHSFCKEVWIPLIFRHCQYSYSNPSRFSSANNHLISEYAGLFIAASKWKFAKSQKWLKFGKKGMEKEILSQHSENGVNKEEASEYIQFITDFFVLSNYIAEKTQNPFSVIYNHRLRKILEYIQNLLDTKGNYIRYGDDDDGKVIMLGKNHHENNFVSHLLTSDILFNTDYSFKYITKSDQKNIILFGEKANKIFTTKDLENDIRESKFFIDEGHLFFRSRTERNDFIEMHLDAAPLGFLSIAAHGHSDALDIQLKINGFDVITDPGTYCYHTDPSWRAYFTSSMAHNTITLNDKNQATYIGPTLWLNHYRCKMEVFKESKDDIYLIASHNGYKKEYLKHSRSLSFRKDYFSIEIIDIISATKDQTYSLKLPFHFHPDSKIALKGNIVFVVLPDQSKIQFVLDTQLKYSLNIGEKEPISGWFSSGFYKKHPSTTIIGEGEFNKSCQIRTYISYAP